MNLSGKFVMRGTAWTVGAYGVSTILRFGSNVVLTRLVTPDVFGVMLVLNTLKTGLEYISDVGIGQNIVHDPRGAERRFRDTAWTVQLVRGALLFLVFFALAGPLAALYGLPASAMKFAALSLLIMGGASVSVHLMHRRLQFVRSNLFDLGLDVVGITLTVVLAYIYPTFWSLILASILSAMIRVGASFFLPDAAVRPAWDKADVKRILHFGKWIYVASLMAFAAASFDKLFLGQAIPLAVLGIYGVARNIADLPAVLAQRLGASLVFPLIAAERDLPREILRGHLGPVRLKLISLCAFGIGLAAAFSDVAVRLVYAQNYHDAGWMLPILLVGAWGSVLCNINEYLLLGIGKPLYGAIGNFAKLVYLGVGLGLALSSIGLVGAIAVIAFGDLARYLVSGVGQARERLGFFRQDGGATLLLVAVLALVSLLRYEAGFGTTFDGIPL